MTGQDARLVPGGEADIEIKTTGEAEVKKAKREADVEKATREADERELTIYKADGTTKEAERRASEFSYVEIKNVLGIESDPLYNAALKEWYRKEAYLSNRVDRREKRSADLTNQIFNIVGFFSVFQGVVLTAVSQLKSQGDPAVCGLLWLPIVLSSIAAVVSIIGVSIKFRTLKELEDSIHDEKRAQKEAAGRADRLRGQGKAHFRFHQHAKEPYRVPLKSFSLGWISVVVALLLFTAIFILSYCAILCNSFK